MTDDYKFKTSEYIGPQRKLSKYDIGPYSVEKTVKGYELV
jgi:hypothetical protein